MKIPVYLSGRSAHEACRAEPKADYVPTGKTADLLYCRIGNPSPELICQVLKHDAKVTCYFPVGAKAGAQMPHALWTIFLPTAKSRW